MDGAKKGVVNMKEKILTRFAAWLLAATFGMTLSIGSAISVFAAENTDSDALQTAKETKTTAKKLLLGGMTFGVKLHTDGTMVVGMGDTPQAMKGTPAYRAGLRIRDVILAVNGKKISGSADVLSAVGASEGKPLTLTVRRDDTEKNFTVMPERSADGMFTIGVWLRDSSAGIGTVTFIDPETLAFGGLGHGICDRDTGKLVPMKRGDVRSAVITGITKGKSGKPGELRGSLGRSRYGSLLLNSACGVFGVYAELPDKSTTVEVAAPSEITLGKATLYTALDESEVRGYEIEISSIVETPTKTKCFTIRVTDPRLIEKTGGIVQGMSGSPIVQNGKLVGAVTHVTISDACDGYGIFIENMLAEMPESIRP